MKKFFIPLILSFCLSISLNAQTKETKVTADASDLRYKINKNIYGHFSEHLGHCIYGGIWVGVDSKIPNTNGIRNDVVEALKKIKIPVLRWPGGCFADEYHWMDGIGPRDKRPEMINTNWGGVTEDNSFGTHEFMELCRLLECEPYFSGNMGSGTIREMSQWVEYLNSDNVSPMTDLRKKNGREKSWGVKYWGMGNETWGCGGNMMPDYYADLLRRYGTYLRNYGYNRLFKIASGGTENDYNWTETLMKNASSYMQGYSLHHYSFANGKTATDFDEKGWFDIMRETLRMDDLINKHGAIMDKYDPNKKIGLMVDEWGTWYAVEPGTNPGFLYQQNTMRDAVAAGSNLNIFNNHCDRVWMANIAQLVNVLQAVILTNGDKMILTPTYHVFDMYKVHQDAFLLPVKIETPDYVLGDDKLPSVNCSASIDNEGKVHISLCNIDPNSGQKISCAFEKFIPKSINGQVLTSDKMNAHNTFDKPNVVKPAEFSDFKLAGNNIEVNMPPMSVVVLELGGKLELTPPPEIKNAKPGINYNYYEGQWDKIPSFAMLKPLRSGIMENFVIPNENSNEDFGVQYAGYIKIPKDGLYTFFINSDDGTDLIIDKKIIVDNDGRHAPQEGSGSLVLKAGYHEIKVDFFQAGGGMVLDVSIEGPGMKKEIIPAGMIFH